MVLIALCVLYAAVLVGAGSWRQIALDRNIPVYPNRVRAATEKIDPNIASVASLRRLPGIGQKTAQKIVDYRRLHSSERFERPEDLMSINGIGPKKVQRIRSFIDMRNQQ